MTTTTWEPLKLPSKPLLLMFTLLMCIVVRDFVGFVFVHCIAKVSDVLVLVCCVCHMHMNLHMRKYTGRYTI